MLEIAAMKFSNNQKIMKSPVRNVWRLLGASVILLAATSVHAVALKNMTYASLPGDKLEVKLEFDGAPPEVKGYSIDRPARVALDLIGASSDLASKYHNLGAGNARNITVVEAKDRTRLIVNLVQAQGYSTEVDGNSIIVILGDEKNENSSLASSEQAAGANERGLKVVDFRRGSQGEGQVVISLSQSSIPVDVREEGGRIIARFVGAELPKDLHRRLDVTDFATPVRFVDAKYDGKDSVISIESTGTWEYLAYQADDQFTINVKPMSQAESAKRKQDAFQYTGEKLSLSFQDIEVRSVLQLIADFTGLNLVASDTVSGRITLRLQNVPWDQALDLILKTKGLDKRKIGNVLLVAPADEIAAREQLELESQKKVEALAPLRTQYIRINYAKAADMAALIQKEGSLLTARGTITTDERTNTLIIQDTEAKLTEVSEVVSILDIPVQQVLIESRVVIASTNVAKEMGVRWGVAAFNQNPDIGHSTWFGGSREGLTENIEGVLENNELEIGPSAMAMDFGVQGTNASRFALGFFDADSGLIDLELSALDAQGDAELVATPKVLTADQQPALIASGQQIGYQTATASGATQIAFIEAELRLEVTPQITPEGKVLMEIKVNNDSLNSDSSSNRPLLDTNRLETSVLVGDGETVVLGGIFQQAVSHSVVKTPLLGDLPWIGNLFRKKTNSDIKQELLIFITPKVVKDTYATN
jgi:type IV pilus assembly protein PilQ